MPQLERLSISKKLQLAEDLLYGYVGSKNIRSRLARKILKKRREKHEILDTIIQLCGPLEERKAFFLLGKAFANKGRKFSGQAIHFFLQYLEQAHVTPEQGMKREHLLYFYEACMELGYAYEQICNFSLAIEYYKKARSLGLPAVSPIPLMKSFSQEQHGGRAITLLKKMQQPRYKRDYGTKCSRE